MKRMRFIYQNVIVLLLLISTETVIAQFEGPAGTAGSSAMFRDSSDFVDWAVGCTLQRGYRDLAYPSLGFVTFGTPIYATGFPDGQPVSLGDSGLATITFASPIINGPGNDFAVFENSFLATFLELAFVEVSSDGINFFRFPATSNTQTATQIGPFDTSADATLLNNLAGKYSANYGTPFDLEELAGTSGLDLQSVTHVKIIDVVGSIYSLFGSQDQFGTYINDPYPTSFESGGFDLDAVGVIHQQPLTTDLIQSDVSVSIYPVPAGRGENILIKSDFSFETAAIHSVSGKLIDAWNSSSKQIESLSAGVYIISFRTSQELISRKLIVE